MSRDAEFTDYVAARMWWRVRDIAGMYLGLSLDGNVPGTSKPLPGQASLGSALSVARRLHLLGTSPAGWTANPVG